MNAIETPYVTLTLFAALVALAINVFTWRHRRTPGAVPLGALVFGVFVWCMTSALIQVVPGSGAKLLLVRIQYFGITTVPLAWLVFVLVYVGRGDVLTRRRLLGLSALPVATVVIAWTNWAHGLIWRSVQFEATGTLTRQIIVHGPWFWVHATYSYVLLAAGTGILVYKLITFEWLYRDQSIALLAGAIVPWIGNASYLVGFTPPGLDPTPIAFSVSGVAIAAAVFRQQLLELVPVAREIARETVIENMADGVVVLNAENRIVDLNPTARSIVGLAEDEALGRPLETVQPGLAALVDEPADHRAEIELAVDGTTRHFDVRITPLRHRSDILAGCLLNLRDVTAHKRAKARHRALVEHSSDVITVLDADGVIRYESPAVWSVLGYDQDDLVGEDAFEHIHPDDVERVRQTFARAVTDEEATPTVTYRFRTSDGGWRTLESVGTNRLDDPAVDGVVINSRDVTERVRHERRMESLHEGTREIMGATTATSVCETSVSVAENVLAPRTVSIHLVDDDGSTLRPVATTDGASAGIERPVSRTDAGTNLAWRVLETGEVYGPADADTFVRSSTGTDAGGDARTHGRTIVPIGDHGVLTAHASGERGLDATDAYFARLLAATTEVALDRVEREETIAALHEATRELVEATSEREIAVVAAAAAREVLGFPLCSVRLVSADGRRLEPTAARAGSSVAADAGGTLEVEGRSSSARALKRGGPVVEKDVDGSDDSLFGEHARSELSLPLGDYGTLAIGSAEPRAFTRYDVSLARVLAANTEIGLRQLEREARLRERTDELERQNQRLDEFASVVSHDLRNPLNVATLNLELFAETGDEDRLEGVVAAHEHMEEILEKVLDLARQGQIVDEPDPVSLQRVVDEAWSTVETTDADLLADVEATILADATRLRELLENLFRNSVEHGGSDVTVRVGKLEDGFFVGDDGPGIPEEDREQVFESGYSTVDRGTGFGLAIVSQIAEAHGWSVSLIESPDGGARVGLTGVERADRPVE